MVKEPDGWEKGTTACVPRITFIASYPKSGNTLVRWWLTAYKEGKLDRLDDIFTMSDSWPTHFQNLSTKPIPQWTSDDWCMFQPAAMHRLNQQLMDYEEEDCPGSLVKTHHQCVMLNDISIIPLVCTKRVIYVVRDPRDVAVSLLRPWTGLSQDDIIQLMFNPGHISRFHSGPAEGLYQIFGSWDNHIKSWAGGNIMAAGRPMMLLKYEDMSEDNPHEARMETLKQLIEFVGWEWDALAGQRTLELCAAKRCRALEKKYGFKELLPGRDKFIGDCKVGQRSKLTAKQHNEIFMKAREAMGMVGYDTETGTNLRRV